MQRNYSSNVPLTKVHEGGEPAEFKALFSVWERERVPGQIKPIGNRIGNHSSELVIAVYAVAYSLSRRKCDTCNVNVM